MVVVEEKRIGSVRITRPTPGATPTPITPSPPRPKAKPRSRREILSEFLEEHRKVKRVIDERAGAECITKKEILDRTGITEERLRMHLEILKNTKLATDVTKDMICSYGDLKSLKERMERIK